MIDRDEKIDSIRPGILLLVEWFRQNARPLPWRAPPGESAVDPENFPYRVWVSEIMLQQTRIEAVIPYYHRFITMLPTVRDLAEAPEDKLLKLWEGLGYYSRARNLQKAARQITERYGGRLPADFGALRELSGIGDYTAGAVASIAFGIPVPAVDGNVLRVAARLLDCGEDVTQPAVKKALTEAVTALMPPEAGLFNQAIMELGETVCLPNAVPKCITDPLFQNCPMRQVCLGHQNGTAADLPYRSPKRPRKIENRTVLIIRTMSDPPAVLIRKREDNGLLAGMWEPPNFPGNLTAAEAAEEARRLSADPGQCLGLEPGRHIFTHIEWRMNGYCIDTAPFIPPDGYRLAALSELSEYAVPTAFRPFTRLLPILLES